ncbi:hypothetical protein [Nostoc sp.]|uniref:hypothetical protein n=1 Tax=Nostoc sp. TaxID=1180 RepID=UPI002FFD3654
MIKASDRLLTYPLIHPSTPRQNSKFKIQTGIQRKRFIDLEWLVYLRRVVLVTSHL